MSQPQSKALTKRDVSTALMPPPPAPKRIKRPSIVLDEDTYTSAISHIIRRDYFPGLAETDAQRDYLSALDSKDKGWIREAGKKLTEVMTPVPSRRARATRFESKGADGGRTPSVWGADTPRTQAGEEEKDDGEEGLGKLDHVDLDMGLGAFQAKYTSEDQESFNQILDRANRKRFEKKAWLHDGNKYASKQRLAQQRVLEACTPSTATDLVVRPSQDLDVDRPAAPNTHKHTAFNTLMFRPDSVEAWAPTRAQHAEDASLAPPKRVLHHNTRLPVHDAAPARPPSPTLSAVRDAIAGRPRLSASEGGYTGNETPRVNGYAFVDAHPPSDDDEDDAPTDLLERFGATGSTATPFTMHDAAPREQMHHRMVDKIASSRRPESASAFAASTSTSSLGHGLGIFKGEAKTPRFVSAPTPAMRAAMTPGARNAGALTPAAQRLFDRMGSTPRVGSRGGFEGGGGGGRQWATPTPKVKRRV
ncbi:uncharacterized protein CC84DRAFT_517608 [Paraphaeosphaeria sporulosa]|uniref:Nuclear protein DGCR14 n=1 Tax=Paraphaeosphaeria sporulosa TaxID=1460663 RepID=A0A177CVX9_9PLEO|nr:uncharacterized protein CC84DRAFT_517608 [Paraphaeosphaeria sporulosa]OAG11052.1 hypothetical protein CC84DRAFT_517608 [Paraphaeosphaeria sporulosa]